MQQLEFHITIVKKGLGGANLGGERDAVKLLVRKFEAEPSDPLKRLEAMHSKVVQLLTAQEQDDNLLYEFAAAAMSVNRTFKAHPQCKGVMINVLDDGFEVQPLQAAHVEQLWARTSN